MFQVHYNGGSSMHCYGTRFGGKSATEITVRRNTWEDQRNVRVDHQRGRATSCCEDDILSTVGDLGHQLRSRSHKWMPSSFLVTNAENDSHLRFGHISQGSNSEPQPARTSRDSDIHFNIDSDKKLNLITARKKRLTAEEKLIEDNKAYYKLEMKNNKLRSSYYFSGSRHITDMGQTFSKETVSLPTLLKDPTSVNSSVGSKVSDHKSFGNRKFSDDGTSDGCKLRSSRKVEEQNINDHNLDRDDSGDKKGDQGKDNTEVQKGFHELKCSKRTFDDSDLKTDQKVNSCRKVCDHKSQLKRFNSEKSSPKESSDYRKSLKDRFESKANLDNKVKNNAVGSGPHRIRLSELSRLSNEAENFMFGEPVRKESSDESSEDEVFQKGKVLKKDDTHDDKEKVKRNPCNTKDCLNKKSEEKDVDMSNCSSCVKVEDSSCDTSNTLHCDESSMGSVDTCSIGSNSENSRRRRRKRRTQAEAFIHDNLDYYKFEIPGSRLRFQGSILPQTPTLMNHATSGCGITQDNTISDDRNSDFNKENNCISSELEVCAKIDSNLPETRESSTRPQENPPSETETAHSKPDPKIKDEDCNGSAVKDNVSVLQFSFEAVPHNEPWYQTYQRQDEGEEIYLSSAGDATYWKPFLLPYEMPPSELFGESFNSPVYSRPGTVVRRKKRTNRFAHLVDDKNPRKSPRCHASTLAILSDLMHYRKRKEPDKHKDEESLNSVSEDDDLNRDDSSSVSTTKQSSVAESVGESATDLKELAKRIDEMLSYSSNDNVATRLPDSSKISCEVGSDKAKTKPVRSGIRKSLKSHRQKNVNNVEQYCLKESDGVDLDPIVAEQLALDAANYKFCLPKPSIRSRGGPLIDVVTLLDGFSDCTCTEEVSFSGRECVNCGSEVISSSNLIETSCNGSEYEASSTCETVVYSDAPESKLTLPGRKRKRKKNRTGWPVGKKRIYKKVGKTGSFTNKSTVVSILTKQRSNGVGTLSASGISRVSAVELCSKAADSERVKETDHSNIVNKLEESVLCKSCETIEKLSSKDELENISLPADSVSIEKQLDKSLDIVSSSIVTDQQKLEKHNRLLRTGSLDSSTQCSQLQPCVRVKKISNISDYIYVPSGVSNNRRLRSASSSSLTIPPILKKDLADESVKELNRRSSRKKTPTKFTDNWESWLPPSRR